MAALSRRALLIGSAASNIGWTHGSQAPASTDVVLVSGQSNAIGFGLLASDLPSYLQPSDAGIKIWNGSAFVTLVNGTNNAILTTGPSSSQNWGPEAEFSYRYRQANPAKTLYIMKYAVSGSQLATNPVGQDWNPASISKYFSFMETFTANAMAAISGVVPAPRVKWLLWMQGEADALDSTNAAAYSTNLPTFIAAVKSRWGDAASKVILGRISNSSIWTFRSSVRSAQAATGLPDRWINTDGYPLQGDQEHYTAAGQVSLGADMWAAI